MADVDRELVGIDYSWSCHSYQRGYIEILRGRVSSRILAATSPTVVRSFTSYGPWQDGSEVNEGSHSVVDECVVRRWI